MAMPNPYQNQHYQQYQQQQVMTAPPDKLLLMLFDGAIRFCNQAKKALEDVCLEECHKYIVKAQGIILELKNSLNMDYELSHQLFSLYDYLHRQLVEANIKKETALLDEVIGFLTELRQTWAEAAVQARRERKLTAGGGSLER
jgi:flagellar protein FliS